MSVCVLKCGDLFQCMCSSHDMQLELISTKFLLFLIFPFFLSAIFRSIFLIVFFCLEENHFFQFFFNVCCFLVVVIFSIAPSNPPRKVTLTNYIGNLPAKN